LNPTRKLTTALKKHFLKTKNHSYSNMKLQLLQIVSQQLDREETINPTTYCCGNKMDLKPTNIETTWFKLNTY